MFSGGVASSALLCHALRAGCTVYAHHIVMQKPGRNFQAIHSTCHSIARELNQIYGDQLRFSHSGWAMHFDTYNGTDCDICHFTAAQVLRNCPPKTALALGAKPWAPAQNAPGQSTLDPQGEGELFHAAAIGIDPAPHYLTPLADLSASELLGQIDPSLRELIIPNTSRHPTTRSTTPPRPEPTLNQDNSAPGRVLVMLSGGVDSTALLLHYLQQGWDVYAHHIEIQNREKRWRYENRACRRIVQHLSQRYPGQLHYSHSGWASPFKTFYTFDSDLCHFVAPQVLRNLPKGTAVAMGWIREDYEDPAAIARMQTGRSSAIFRAATMDMSYQPDVLMPFKELRKWDLIQSLGPDLLSLTFSCRMPNSDGQPCLRCRTCQDIQQARKQMRIPWPHKHTVVNQAGWAYDIAPRPSPYFYLDQS